MDRRVARRRRRSRRRERGRTRRPTRKGRPNRRGCKASRRAWDWRRPRGTCREAGSDRSGSPRTYRPSAAGRRRFRRAHTRCEQRRCTGCKFPCRRRASWSCPQRSTSADIQMAGACRSCCWGTAGRTSCPDRTRANRSPCHRKSRTRSSRWGCSDRGSGHRTLPSHRHLRRQPERSSRSRCRGCRRSRGGRPAESPRRPSRR